MPLAAGKVVFKQTIKTYLQTLADNTDHTKEGTIDEYVDVLADAVEVYIKSATVLPTTEGVPSMTAPPGGGPITGVGELQ